MGPWGPEHTLACRAGGCGHIADYTTPSPATLPSGGVTMGANEPCQDTIKPEGGPGSCIRSLLSVAAQDKRWCSVQTLDIEIK